MIELEKTEQQQPWTLIRTEVTNSTKTTTAPKKSTVTGVWAAAAAAKNATVTTTQTPAASDARGGGGGGVPAGVTQNNKNNSRSNNNVNHRTTAQDVQVRVGRGTLRTPPVGSVGKVVLKSSTETVTATVEPTSAAAATKHVAESESSENLDLDQKYLHKKFKRIASVSVDQQQQQLADLVSAGDSEERTRQIDASEKGAKATDVPRNGLHKKINSNHHSSKGESSSCDSAGGGDHRQRRLGEVVGAEVGHPSSSQCVSSRDAQRISSGSSRVPLVATTTREEEGGEEDHQERQSTRPHIHSSGHPVNSAEEFLATECDDNGVSSPALQNNNNNNNHVAGRNVCHYCNLNCTKPSVLEKHIRSHTNERPYPCVPCGFAFKTKSNLYKHCRSRAHQLRAPGQGGGEDEISAGSDQELSSSASGSDEVSRTASPVDESMMGSAQQTDKPYKPKFHKAVLYDVAEERGEEQTPISCANIIVGSSSSSSSSSSGNHISSAGSNSANSANAVRWGGGVRDIRTDMAPHQQQQQQQQQQQRLISMAMAAVPPAPIATMLQQQSQSQPQPQQHHHHHHLPPHGATSSVAASLSSAMLSSDSMKPSPFPSGGSGGAGIPPRLSHLASQPYNLEQHISKLISRNEAIIEDVEPALQKKYHKITGKSRGNSLDLNACGSSKSQAAALQQLQQFQAKLNREDGLSQHQQQYNHLARRASTPAGISLPAHFGAMTMNMAALKGAPPVSPKAPKVPKQQQSTASQPLNLTKPTNIPSVPVTLLPQPVKGATSKEPAPAAPSNLPISQSAPTNLSTAAQQQLQQQQQKVHNVSSLTTLITNKLLKNTNMPNMKDFIDNLRKQFSSAEGSNCGTDINISSHPQNPERSIIKGLLLDWKSVSNNGLEGSSNTGGDATCSSTSEDASYMCPVCKITFRNADTLQCHTKSYCQGNNVDKFSPTTLVNLARYKLRTTPHNQKSPSPLAKLAQTMLGRNKGKPGNIVIGNTSRREGEVTSASATVTSSNNPHVECVIAPLPSPGPLLGKTRLVDTYPATTATPLSEVKLSQQQQQQHQQRAANNNASYLISSAAASSSGSLGQSRQMHVKNIPEPLILASNSQRPNGGVDKMMHSMLSQYNNHTGLEMFGGELQILPKGRPEMGKSRPKDFQLEFTGGSIVSESPLSDNDQNQISIRTPGLFSGGKVEKSVTSRSSPPITPLTPSLLGTPNQYTPSFLVAGSHFQFPPINPITAYNPLTLPTIPSPLILAPQHAQPMKVYSGRLIPEVPGMPGPETMHLRINPPLLHNSLAVPNSYTSVNRSPSPRQSRGTKRSSSASPIQINVQNSMLMAPPQTNGLLKTMKLEPNDEKLRSPKERKTSRPLIWSPANLHADNKKSFYFNRSGEKEEVKVDEKTQFGEVANNRTSLQIQADVDSFSASMEGPKMAPLKFLRPSSLNLEPGTFTPKKHHGITPTANTLPLISPETPRPSKSCVQSYINGQAYTTLGLKSSTKPYYCTVNRTQPIYLPDHTVSMYSVWQVRPESSPHPLGLSPDAVIGLYDSRQNQSNYSSAAISTGNPLKLSQGPIMTPYETQRNHSLHHYVTARLTRCPTPEDLKVADAVEADAGEARPVITQAAELTFVEDQKKDSLAAPVSVVGGYESNEDYEYIKGRGYGRYVCETCGIRCRKPSMLKKHIRTHTNIRPFTCQYCCFSFKTKGNLTKHMKSKSHAKKCEELGVCPLPMAEDMMEESVVQNFDGSRLMTIPGDSDSDHDSDCDDPSDGSDTEDIKTRLPQEQEAARGLLSLSMTPPINMNPAEQPYRHPPTLDRLGEDLSVKTTQSRSEYAVQKITFEFPRTEQYYSNPNIAKPSAVVGSNRTDPTDNCDDMPMDLTKPRTAEKAPRVVFPQIMEPAGLISSLVSITDKIAPVNSLTGSSELDESALLQKYLTERAMHGTKMKQSQQKTRWYKVAKGESKEDGPMLHQYLSERNATTERVSKFVDRVVHVAAENEVVTTKQEEVEDEKVSVANPAEESHASGMDTLADIAANSAKLNLREGEGSGAATSRNTTAKFVASEYLKMATQRKPQKSDREDGESSSDQEAAAAAAMSSEAGGTGRKRMDSVSDIVSDIVPRTVVVVKDPQNNSTEFISVGETPQGRLQLDDGRSKCTKCEKTFQKPSQLKLHMNIHYFERNFRCDPCGVSFRTQGHMHKHERSGSHLNKVSMTSTFGVPTTVNPRPFNCTDCAVAFRIHGHLAKHLRSKMHVLKLECLFKIPFGTYAEIERAGINLTAIDTTDCESSLSSLRILVRQFPELTMNGGGGGGDRRESGAGNEGQNRGSGDESDNEDSEHGASNGYADSLSGNENNERTKGGSEEGLRNGMSVTLKRKFGTLLNGNETEEDVQSGEDVVVTLAGGTGGGGVADAGSQGDVVTSGNSTDSRKEFGEGATGIAAMEKRIKVT